MSEETKNSTGVTLPYEKQAMNGEEMPEGLDFPDQIMFLQLRMLYDQFKKGIINRETAQKEKKQLLAEYQCYKFQWEMLDDCAKLFKRTDIARADFRKNPTVENGWKLLYACEGRKTA